MCIERIDIVDRFVAAVERCPSQIAVSVGRASMSYADLDTASARVAALVTTTVGPDAVVAVKLSDQCDDVSALLGVLRAGCVFLPRPSGEPQERAQFVMQNAQPAAVLRMQDGTPQLEPASGRTVLPPDAEPLAYILYTSGSTGTPKGVAMRRNGLSRLIDWQIAADGASSSLPTLQFAPLTFDVAFQEIFSTLGAGGTLVRMPATLRRDPVALLEYVRDNAIGRLFLPTAMLPVLANAASAAPPLTCLRQVYVAGEQLRITPAIRHWFACLPLCRLHNHYGPTETHVVTACTLPVAPGDWPDLPPIGQPLPGVLLTLAPVDGDGPDAGAGHELLVGGERLAAGYLNLPEETAARFVTDMDGELWYRTGDLVELREDSLFFQGRIGRQVKIAGQRVELAEVEVALGACPGVRDAAVVADLDSDGRTRLVAYIVTENSDAGRQTTENSDAGRQTAAGAARWLAPPWRRHLAERLPDAMLPTVWIVLARLPLTANGKLDRAALPPVASVPLAGAATAAAAHESTEARIAASWSQVLQLDEIGRNTTFFDLGGTSLLAMTVTARLSDEFGQRISPLALFEHSTVRAMARFLDGAKPDVRHPSSASPATSGPIAIVGMACRFPGASNPEEFWRNLCNGIESITRTTAGGGRPGRVSAAGLIGDIERFDAALFGISPVEASRMDPQHRKFLECVWEALEDAGIDPKAGGERTGIFAGCGPSSYLLNNLHPADWRPDRSLLDSAAEVMLLSGNDKDFLTARTSFVFDFGGPSVNLNAACATSLVAVHYAVRSLRDADCDVAIAGAACIPVPQLTSYQYETQMPFSPDGYCRPFDRDAAGTVFGSGVGVVVLKRLADALADGDNVYALIRGSAVNNDGKRKITMSAPSVEGQARVVRAALADAGVDPQTVDYVEAHGTATIVGDPIEVAALTRAFQSTQLAWCGIGSVKSNVGHLGWASGMAGLLKAALSLRHGVVPPTINFTTPNPTLDLASTPFFVTDTPLRLAPAGRPARIGVSAFGLGGGNAHLVLEQAEQPLPPAGETPLEDWQLVPVSAATVPAMAAVSGRLVQWLASERPEKLRALAAAAQTGRHHHPVRQAHVVQHVAELRARLASTAPPKVADRPRPVAGLFSGHGSEYPGLGRGLYSRFATYRAAIDGFDPVVLPATGLTTAQILYAGVSAITDVVDVHIAVFATGLALFALWEAAGISFDVLMGHSLGEYVAAAAAGVMSAQDGMSMAIARGRLIARTAQDGRMASVMADDVTVSEALKAMGADVDIAAANGRRSTVISGHVAAVHAACQGFAARGVETVMLNALRAGHSSLVDPIQPDVAAIFSGIALHPPRRTLIANRTGRVAGPEVAQPDYWAAHLRDTVQFAGGLRTAAGLGVTAYVELGGDPVLLSLIDRHQGLLIPSLRRRRTDAKVFLTGVAALYTAGHDITWSALTEPGQQRSRLPTYPMQGDRHWIAANAAGASCSAVAAHVAAPGAVRWQDCAYALDWQPRGPFKDASRPSRHYLLLTNRPADVATVRAALQANGSTVTVVAAGSVAALEAVLAAEAGRAVTVVNALPLALPDLADTDVADIASLLRWPIEAGLACMRALHGRADGHYHHLWTVTRGAWRAMPGDDVAVLQTVFAGLDRVAAVEMPDLLCATVDLARGEALLPADVLAELLSSEDAETTLAIRDGLLLVQRLQPVMLDVAPARLRSDAGYLLVGGLGGLGLAAARTLVAAGARRLWLAGRQTSSASAIEAVAELRRDGAQVDIIQLDVTDGRAVEDVVRSLAAADVPLRGIVQLAGVLKDGLITSLTWPAFQTVLAPKAQGAWNLHAASVRLGLELDLFAIYSSATAMIGNAGQANYAAANMFVDGLAQRRHARGAAGTSINWGVWSDSGHVAARPELLAGLMARGMRALPSQVAADALLHALSFSGGAWRKFGTAPPISARAQIGFVPTDWPRFLATHNLASVPLFERLWTPSTPAQSRELGIRDVLAALHDADDRQDILVRYLVAAVIALTPAQSTVEPGDVLRDAGLDSLSLIQLRNQVQTELGVPLPAQLTFRYPTIGHLAEYLARQRFGPAEPASAALAGSPQNDGAHPPLTIQQKRWLSLNVEVRYGHRVVPAIFYAALDPDCLVAALRTVVERHALLRLVYGSDPPSCWTTARVVAHMQLTPIDLRSFNTDGRARVAARIVERMRVEVPDPRIEPSWHLRCLHLSDDRFALLIGGQHLDFDGPALSVFIDEMRHCYRVAITDEPGEPLPDVVPYSRFARQQYAYLKSAVTADRSYFEGLFTGVSRRSLLPGSPDATATVALRSVRHTPEHALASATVIRQAALTMQVSPLAIVLSTYARLIAEVLNADIATIAMIRSGRVDKQFSRTIGPFTMPFPVPVHVGRLSPHDLAQQCERVLANVGERADYPSTDLIATVPAFSGLPQDTYFSDFGLNFVNYRHLESEGQPKVDVLEVLAPVIHPEFTQCRFGELQRIPGFHLVADLSGDELRGNYWYHQDRVGLADVRRWCRRHAELVDDFLQRAGAVSRAGAK